MLRRTVVILGALLVSGLVLGAALFAAALASMGPSPAGVTPASDITASARARTGIPGDDLRLYRAAATTCPGLPWTVLAAIGTVESSDGTSDLPGVHTGANVAGAEVIYRWDGGLWHQRDEAVDGRGSLVSEGSLARGQGGGHSGFLVSPAHDDQISSVASGVAV